MKGISKCAGIAVQGSLSGQLFTYDKKKAKYMTKNQTH